MVDQGIKITCEVTGKPHCSVSTSVFNYRQKLQEDGPSHDIIEVTLEKMEVDLAQVWSPPGGVGQAHVHSDI